jgi:hypothetical protein
VASPGWGEGASLAPASGLGGLTMEVAALRSGASGGGGGGCPSPNRNAREWAHEGGLYRALLPPAASAASPWRWRRCGVVPRAAGAVGALRLTATHESGLTREGGKGLAFKQPT